MWLEALKIAVTGFTVVILTLIILAVCIKFMSNACKIIDKGTIKRKR